MQSAYTISDQPITVLLIESDESDARLIQELLPGHQVDVTTNLADGFTYLTGARPNIIFLSLSLSDEGSDTVRRLRDKAPDVPIVVFVQFESEEMGIQAIREGAQAYLVKSEIDSRALQRSIYYALGRQQVEVALRDTEERFRIMFEQAAVGLAFVDIDGRFKSMNPHLCAMVGYSNEELLQKTFSDITHPDDLDEDWAYAKRLLAGEIEHYTMEKRYIHKDNSIVWVNLTGTLVRTESGLPNYFLAIIQNITERKKAEEVKSYMAAIVESSEDGIIGKDLEGKIISWNAAAERIYGWPAEEATSQSILLIYPPGYEEEHEYILAKIRAGESVSRLETKRLHKDGRLLDIALTVSPIKDPTGRVIGASTIERDITSLKWAQTAQEESEQRLRQLTESIDEVLWLRDVATGQILYVSAAFAKLWGITVDHIYENPQTIIDYVHPEDRDRVQKAMQRHIKGNFNEEFRIVRDDGQERWVRAHTSPILNQAGEVYRVAGLAEDVTEYKRLVHAEQQQRALAEALRNISNALNSTVDTGEILDRLLTNIGHVVEHDAAEIILIEGEKAKIVRSRGYASRGLKQELEALDFVVSETPNLNYMYRNKKPLIIPDVDQASPDRALKVSPALFWHSYAGVPISLKGEVIGFINLGSLTPYFFTPIHADRLQAFAEQAAIALQNAKLYEDTRELAAHHERQRLARDLHDAVSQTLFAATILTEGLVRQWEVDPVSVGAKLADLHQLTRGALAETRAVLLELRPESLAEISFKNLLEQLIEAIKSRKQLNFLLNLDYGVHLEPDLKLVLYRITQEALSNIVKHAQASEVTITVAGDELQLILEICDDGVGFDPRIPRPNSMGLSIMKERAAGIGAEVEILSDTGQGTRITVTWKNHTGKATS